MTASRSTANANPLIPSNGPATETSVTFSEKPNEISDMSTHRMLPPGDLAGNIAVTPVTFGHAGVPATGLPPTQVDDDAHHLRDSHDGLKIGAHQAASAWLATT